MSLLDHPTAQALLADAQVSATAVSGCSRRLERFLQRYLPRFYRVEQHDLARVVLQGKLSGLQRKTSEPIAYQAGVDAELWQGTPAASVEPRLGAGIALARGWRLFLWGAYGWGIASSSDVEASCLRGGLAIDYLALRYLRVGLGAAVRGLAAHVPQSNSPTTSPGPTSPSVSPPETATALPDSTTNRQWPRSPSVVSASPSAKDTSAADDASASSSWSGSPAKSEMRARRALSTRRLGLDLPVRRTGLEGCCDRWQFRK